MSMAAFLVRTLRRSLDLALLVLIAGVIVVLVLARGLPELTGGTTFVVGGPSMEPTIPIGAVVLAEPVAAEALRTGDVVSLQVGPDRAIFTHRIIQTVTRPDGLYLRTKGDGNQDPDPSLVPASSVIGRVTFHLPWAGYGMTLLSSTVGVAFVVCLGLSLLAGAWLLEALEDDLVLTRHHRAMLVAAGLVDEDAWAGDPGTEPEAAG
jgi:signal peptidase